MDLNGTLLVWGTRAAQVAFVIGLFGLVGAAAGGVLLARPVTTALYILMVVVYPAIEFRRGRRNSDPETNVSG